MEPRLIAFLRVYLAIVLSAVALAVQQIVAVVLSLGDLIPMGLAKHSVSLKHGKVLLDNERELSIFDLPIGGNGLLWGSLIGIFIIIIYAIANKGPWLQVLALRKFGIKAAIHWILAFIAFGIISIILERQFETFHSDDMERMVRSSMDSPIMLFVAVGLLAPVFEELLFRGWLFGKLNESYGGILAVLVTSVLFTLIHMQYGWMIRITIMVLSLILGMIRLRTGSVLASMVVHIANNVIATILAMQSQSGS